MALINIMMLVKTMLDHPVSGFLFANALKMAEHVRNGPLNGEKELGWLANHGYVCLIMSAQLHFTTSTA